ncbi:hypothetical protein K438DRAFT_1565710, partial [Mycena galopus ATCC 62051]
ANLLYWTSSIMDFTYSFLHLFLSNTDEEPPFTIPQLRFVHAGVAVSHDQVAGIEEFIDEESDGFVKFVHTGDANPLLDRDNPFYSIAEFLCFTQHAQYFKTEGTVFLSDLPGMHAIGKDIFGGGNVGSVFEKFPHQHSCNAYCSWFNLPVMNRSKRDSTLLLDIMMYAKYRHA